MQCVITTESDTVTVGAPFGSRSVPFWPIHHRLTIVLSFGTLLEGELWRRKRALVDGRPMGVGQRRRIRRAT